MSELNKALARRFYDEVLSKKNLTIIDDLMAADVIDHTPLPGQAPGLPGLKKTLNDYLRAFPDISVAVDTLVAEGDVVVARIRGTGTHKGMLLDATPTGQKVSFHGIDMFQMKDGKAVEVWHEGNDALVMMQLGVQLPVAG